MFRNEGDYAAFERVLEEARDPIPMRVLCFCVMPNHWHLVLWPEHDGDLSESLRWLTVTHTAAMLMGWCESEELLGVCPSSQRPSLSAKKTDALH
ncbi:hypothetical protein [Singulisphaera sp. Ch08]|uniref:hypothetical protein n=1 Tax=Singulisphaera sp. Ch08 TaxID=3120278 RepID=UPI003872C589